MSCFFNISQGFKVGACLCLLLPRILGAVETADPVKTKMIEDLQTIRQTLEVSYAPAEWKASCFDWNLQEQFEIAKHAVLENSSLTVKDFQKIVWEFLKSTKDYHVGVQFWSTEGATLPFNVKGASGKYFISGVDRFRLSPSVFPINAGDELLEFAGRPTAEVIQELKQQCVGDANEMTDMALAEMILTRRNGVSGHTVPQGPVAITVKSNKTGEVRSYQLMWDYSSEKISPPAWKKECRLVNYHPILKKSMLTPFYHALLKSGHLEPELGARQGFLPKLGKVWWENSFSGNFQAYLFETKDKKLVGYIRIPHYRAGEKQVEEFAEIIDFFQERSDALIIDQLSNPGGSLFYLYALASTLTDQPLQTPRHRMTITQKEVWYAVKMLSLLKEIRTDQEAKDALGTTLEGNPVTYQMVQFLIDYCRFILSEWEEGRTLTQPHHLYAIDHINPHPTTRYTKPILLLINHLNFSGGDFFPAILQDNKRVVTMGTQTAGAGGFILSSTFDNLFGIQRFRYTGSLAERPISKIPIENLAVAPDIVYEVTEEDLRRDYRGFVQAIHQAIPELLGGNSDP